MDNYDFFKLFIEALAHSDTLDSWCAHHFDRELSVYADIRSESPPGDDDMPYVLVHTPGVEKGMSLSQQIYTMEMTIAITKDALVSRMEDNLEEPAGIELIMDLVTLVMDEVKDALPVNTHVDYRLSADTMGSLPRVYAYLTLEFRKTVTLGSDPLG